VGYTTAETVTCIINLLQYRKGVYLQGFNELN